MVLPRHTRLETSTPLRRQVNFCAFDRWTLAGHNQLVKSIRRVGIVALLATLVGAPCLGVCAGWKASDHAHMACCADKTQDEADTCCVLGETQQNTDVLAGLVAAALPAPAVDAHQIESILTASQMFTPQWDSHDRIPSDSHRHVRLSVFLI
jgi:hypothetical protein